MKHLLLVRHGKAEDHRSDTPDFSRELVDRGRADVRDLVRSLSNTAFCPSLVLSSTAPRAKETAEILAGLITPAPEFLLEASLYLASAPTILRRLELLENSHSMVAVVAHNPGIRDTASILSNRFFPSFPTAGAVLCSFTAESWIECGHVVPDEVRVFFRAKTSPDV